MRHKLRAGAKLIVFNALAFVILLSLLEIGCRVFVPQYRWLWPELTFTGNDGIRRGVPHFSGRAADLFGEFDVPVQLNAEGFRSETREALDVAVFGDSMCFGWGVRAEDSLPQRIEAELGKSIGNHCIPGADIRDYWAAYLRTPAADRADIVACITLENDILAYADTTAPIPHHQDPHEDRSNFALWVIRHSALAAITATLAKTNATLVSFARGVGLFGGAPAASASALDPLQASTVLLRKWSDSLPKSQRFIVVPIPPRHEYETTIDYDRIVQKFKDAGLTVLDVKARHIALPTFPRDGHWTEAGHQALAHGIAEMLRD